MRISFFNTKPYDRRFFTPELAAAHGHEVRFLDPRLTADTAAIAQGGRAVCAFVNDDLGRPVLERLHQAGIRHLALRSAGYNHVDLDAADALGLDVVRVPAYSPHGVAEHAIALMMTLNRKTHRAFNRVREGNFALDGLLGFEMHGRVVGVVGTGKIGACVARILLGFGCRVLAYDVYEQADLKQLGVEYTPLDDLLRQSEIVTLHTPLLKDTYHLINADTIARMRDGVMLVNTSRGGLIDTEAVIAGLKSGRIGHLALDVYEEEDALFFDDRSAEVLQDDEFARLLTFPNVLITGHQAFFTSHALHEIATTTLRNLQQLETGKPCPNRVERTR